SPEEQEGNRKEALNMLDRVVDDLKNIARSLNAGYLENIGLNEAVRNRMAQLERTKKYEVELYLDDTLQRLDRQKQLILYNISRKL
ncbi:MAG: hypothetical protein HC867_01930, partial [Bacteroidia bacterium]|nr:hypothetical protein [Bacteroidia bacterium]